MSFLSRCMLLICSLASLRGTQRRSNPAFNGKSKTGLHQSLRLIAMTMVLFFFANNAFANDINLYEQPQAAAKIVGTIDSTKGFIPIFSTSDGQWVKVGDPRNGNVGWAKMADLQTTNGPAGISVMQRTVNDPSGVPKSFQVFRFLDPNTTQEQRQKMSQDLQFQSGPHSLQNTIRDIAVELDKNVQEMQKKNNIQMQPSGIPGVNIPVQNKPQQ